MRQTHVKEATKPSRQAIDWYEDLTEKCNQDNKAGLLPTGSIQLQAMPRFKAMLRFLP